MTAEEGNLVFVSQKVYSPSLSILLPSPEKFLPNRKPAARKEEKLKTQARLPRLRGPEAGLSF